MLQSPACYGSLASSVRSLIGNLRRPCSDRGVECARKVTCLGEFAGKRCRRCVPEHPRLRRHDASRDDQHDHQYRQTRSPGVGSAARCVGVLQFASLLFHAAVPFMFDLLQCDSARATGTEFPSNPPPSARTKPIDTESSRARRSASRLRWSSSGDSALSTWR